MSQAVLSDVLTHLQMEVISTVGGKSQSLLKRKGIGLIFPTLHTEILSLRKKRRHAVTQSNSETSAEVLGRVLFSLFKEQSPWNWVTQR